MRTTTRRRPSTTERITGLAYLGIIVTGVFAEFVVRGSLVAPDDPATTATNIAESPGLFRIGIAADLAMIALDVTVAIGLFLLLRSVDRRLAVTATVLRLVQGAVIVLSLGVIVRALGLAQDAVRPDGSVALGPAQEALDAIEAHALGYDAGLIAFGLCCLVLARLLSRAQLVAPILAWGMAATGGIYLAGSLAALTAPDLSAAVEPLYVIPLVVELSFALQLTTRGLRRSDAPTSARVLAAA